MKRQNSSSTLVSPSSATENLHSKTIGCMSGIMNLLSKYQSKRRKFLTFGNSKREKEAKSSPTQIRCIANCTPDISPESFHEDHHKKAADSAGDPPRFSRDVPRSPTLPAEMRRSNPVQSAGDRGAYSSSPALLVRLMGLEGAAAVEEKTVDSPTVDEKRKKLLLALEKCDEDLKALKKIIGDLQSPDSFRSPSIQAARNLGRDVEDYKFAGSDKCWDQFNCWEQQPSPVSVLDQFSRSQFGAINSKRHPNFGKMNNCKLGECDAGRQIQSRRKHQQQKKKPGEEDMLNFSMIDRIKNQVLMSPTGGYNEESPLWSSKAMKESVDEVCKDIAWGEKREIGRIGLALQDHICRDLIEETVRDMGYGSVNRSLPFEACRRRLLF